MRVHPPQVLQERRKDVQADRHATGHAQGAFQLARTVGNRPNCLAHVLKYALAELDEAFGCGRHPHLPTDAKKKRLPELLFE